MAFSIIADKCRRCYVCIYKCPAKAISTDSGYKSPVVDGSQCVSCGICMEVCPAGAISNR
jgi:NADH-quinone oxidoreductase subunit F/NADP-reducing hydrogenase subunit HndC